jgi:tripartite-type tricarboxylate transporter receptor subunit TctC
MYTPAITRRRLLLSASASAVLSTARAQSPDWPQKPIRLLVGYPAGGITDVMARVVGQKAGAVLGQAIVIDNKPGASSNVAGQLVVKSAPDGYTLLLAPTALETANPFLFKAAFDPSKDLMPVCGVASSQLYLVARPNLEVHSASDLVELARRAPGRLTYASAGNGTPPHLAGELFKQQAGIFVTHIPYRGAAPALQDVMANQVDFFFDPGTALPHIQTGKVKLLGVASARRSPFFPEVPTLSEQGVRATELDIWFGVWAPNGTPGALLNRCAGAAQNALLDPGVLQRFGTFAAEPSWLDSTRFRQLLDRERSVLGELIRARHIKAD